MIITMYNSFMICSGTVMSMLAGCFYGVNFAPVIYIQNHYKEEDGSDVSQNGNET